MFGSNKAISGRIEADDQNFEPNDGPFKDENIVGKVVLLTRYAILRVVQHVNLNNN